MYEFLTIALKLLMDIHESCDILSAHGRRSGTKNPLHDQIQGRKVKATLKAPDGGDDRRSNENSFIIRAAMNNRGEHARTTPRRYPETNLIAPQIPHIVSVQPSKLGNNRSKKS
jgi:hypothetical protein